MIEKIEYILNLHTVGRVAQSPPHVPSAHRRAHLPRGFTLLPPSPPAPVCVQQNVFAEPFESSL